MFRIIWKRRKGALYSRIENMGKVREGEEGVPKMNRRERH
jgi:hypothetical protein